MASISAQKSCTEGGGGAGVVDFDAPCGPVPWSSAFVIVGVASPKAPTRHRLAMIAFSFFILFLLVLNLPRWNCGFGLAVSYLSKNSLTKSMLAYVFKSRFCCCMKPWPSSFAKTYQTGIRSFVAATKLDASLTGTRGSLPP